MLTNALCKSLQRLRVTAKGTILSRCGSTNTSTVTAISSNIYKPPIDADKSIYEPNFRLSSVRSTLLDLNLPRRPGSICEIGEFSIPNLRIGEPPKIERSFEDAPTEKSLELPPTETIIEKRAERMIVIRRRKMRRHKLRKLRKRMKFVWGKKKQKREMAKEKAFQAGLLAKIKAAEAFDAKAFVASRFAILDNVRLPTRYRGELLPESQMREFLRRDEEKREKKFNKPRLTL